MIRTLSGHKHLPDFSTPCFYRQVICTDLTFLYCIQQGRFPASLTILKN